VGPFTGPFLFGLSSTVTVVLEDFVEEGIF
jgi:hypothetical protein